MDKFERLATAYEPIEPKTCSFCGFATTFPGWIETRDPDSFGVGPACEPQDLCWFCQRSYAVSHWLSGGSPTNAERDQLMIANFFRDLLVRRDGMKWAGMYSPLLKTF